MIRRWLENIIGYFYGKETIQHSFLIKMFADNSEPDALCKAQWHPRGLSKINSEPDTIVQNTTDSEIFKSLEFNWLNHKLRVLIEKEDNDMYICLLSLHKNFCMDKQKLILKNKNRTKSKVFLFDKSMEKYRFNIGLNLEDLLNPVNGWNDEGYFHLEISVPLKLE